MSHTVAIETVGAIPLAVVRRRGLVRELRALVPAACGEVWELARTHGVARPGRLVAVYLDEVITFEVGVEVGDDFQGAPGLARSATPAGRVAAAAHVGPYTGLFDAHQAIRAYCRQQGLAKAGPNWEIYGHWSDDPAQVRTDVFYLLT